MEHFNVGDIVVLTQCGLYPSIRNIEVEIMRPFGYGQVDFEGGKNGFSYVVGSPELTAALRDAGCSKCLLRVRPHQIKKLPSHKIVLPDWSMCIFKPANSGASDVLQKRL